MRDEFKGPHGRHVSILIARASALQNSAVDPDRVPDT